MDKEAQTDQFWRSVWVLFGAMVLLFASLIILCFRSLP
jgi:hypothetical protein